MEEIILPKRIIMSIANSELEAIKKSKNLIADFTCANLLYDDMKEFIRLARKVIATSSIRVYRCTLQDEWEFFKENDKYKIAKKLFEAGKFKTLRDAVNFVCD